MDLSGCRLAAGAAPVGCDWCGRLLVARQTRWCSRLCLIEFRSNHVWKFARQTALGRFPACVSCGGRASLEVNHVVPLDGQARSQSCAHHQDNLEVLCHDCHVVATRKQREAGFFSRDRRHDLR